MGKINFTKDEIQTIGDFVHANMTDTMIKPEATKLIDVLEKHKLVHDNLAESLRNDISSGTGSPVSTLMDIISVKITNDQGNEIMKEYYGK